MSLSNKCSFIHQHHHPHHVDVDIVYCVTILISLKHTGKLENDVKWVGRPLLGEMIYSCRAQAIMIIIFFKVILPCQSKY